MLEAQGLCWSVGGQTLLDNVGLKIQPSERVALLGASGSGKTLLLRSLAMLDPVDSGDVLWHGTALRDDDIPLHRSRVIYAHQRPALFEGTVEQMFRQPYELHCHRERLFLRKRVVQWLSDVGRGETFLQKQQSDLSGGEAQLASLFRALQLDPNILLLDEPTSALDEATALTVERLLVDWVESAGQQAEQQRAMVWVSHDRQQADRIATRIVRMANGRMEAN